MDTSHIKSLLEKYYNGTSTIEEESEIMDFFNSASDIPSELETDRKMFEALAAANDFHSINIPKDLETRMEKVIDSLSPKRTRIWRTRILGGSIAAMLAIGMGITSYLHNRTTTAEAITNEQAAAYTEESLNLLLNSVRRASAESAHAEEIIVNTTSTTFKQIKKL